MVIEALSDAKSLYLLTKIALHSQVDSSQFLLAGKTRLSARAFYTRISRLLKAGIIARKNGKYSLTSFGNVIYQAQDLITAAFNNYWRLSALDSLSMLDALPIAEYNKITDRLLGDQPIKKVLLLLMMARHLGQKTTNNKNESPICLNVIPIIRTQTQRSRNTAGGLQVT
jgi:hypothetical protein